MLTDTSARPPAQKKNQPGRPLKRNGKQPPAIILPHYTRTRLRREMHPATAPAAARSDDDDAPAAAAVLLKQP